MLLTGFQGYGGRSANPSASIVEALNGEVINGEPVVAHTLPVTNHNLGENIIALLARHRPSLTICLGLAPGEPMIRLERLAANYSHFEIPDNAGDVYSGPVIDNAASAIEVTLPLVAIKRALLENGIPARVSNTAGTFLCNAITFHALQYCATALPDARCGFIHLPYLPAQVADIFAGLQQQDLELHQRADLASMALETQIKGVRVAIAAALADHRSTPG